MHTQKMFFVVSAILILNTLTPTLYSAYELFPLVTCPALSTPSNGQNKLQQGLSGWKIPLQNCSLFLMQFWIQQRWK